MLRGSCGHLQFVLPELLAPKNGMNTSPKSRSSGRKFSQVASRASSKRRRLFAEPTVELERRADGNLLLRSGIPLAPYPRHIGEHLLRWAREAPRRPFLLERTAGGEWAGVTYGQARSEGLRV